MRCTFVPSTALKTCNSKITFIAPLNSAPQQLLFQVLSLPKLENTIAIST